MAGISCGPAWPQIPYVVEINLNRFSCLHLPNLGLQICVIMLRFEALYQLSYSPQPRQIRFIDGRLAELLKSETNL